MENGHRVHMKLVKLTKRMPYSGTTGTVRSSSELTGGFMLIPL